MGRLSGSSDVTSGTLSVEHDRSKMGGEKAKESPGFFHPLL
jgi:hypothetical protein